MKKLITHEQYVQSNLIIEELINVVDDSMDDSNPLVQNFLMLLILLKLMRKFISLLACHL